MSAEGAARVGGPRPTRYYLGTEVVELRRQRPVGLPRPSCAPTARDLIADQPVGETRVNLTAVLLTGLVAGGVSCAAVQGGLLAGLITRQNEPVRSPNR